MDYYTGIEAVGMKQTTEAPLKVEPISREEFRVLSGRRHNTAQCHLSSLEIDDSSPLKDNFKKTIDEILKGYTRNEAKAEEFKARWNESSKVLEKTPLKPLISEIGEQLAAGKLNPKSLQKALGEVTFPAKDMMTVGVALNKFRGEMQKLYGLDIVLKFRGEGNEISLEGFTIAEANGSFAFNAQIYIDKTEPPQSKSIHEKGFAGPIEEEISNEDAMRKLHEHVIGRQRK